MIDPDQVITIGRLGKPRGVNGEMLAYASTGEPDRFLDLKALLVRDRDAWTEMSVASTRLVGDKAVIRFAGIKSPEEAARLTNRDLALPRRALGDPEPGSYFVFDLIGCRVLDDNGNEIGELTEVEPYPANDVYLVAGTDGRRWLCPAVATIVKTVDIAQRTVTVDRNGLLADEPPPQRV